MKTKNLLMLLAIAGIMIFASCKKDETPTLTKEEATIALTALNTNFADVNEEFNNTDAILVLNAFDEIVLPYGLEVPLKKPSSSKDFKDKYSKAFKNGNTKSFSENNPFIYFDFESNVGTYTFINYEWSYSPIPQDKIVLIFPYKTGTATITYYDYQTKEFESDTYISRLKFKAEISGLSIPVYTWEYTASRSDNGASISFNHNFGVFSRYEAVTMSSTQSLTSFTLQLSFEFSFKKNNNIILAETANVSMAMSGNSSSVEMDIKVTILNIVINYSFNSDEAFNMNGDPSKYMTISVWTTDGVKVADVIFKKVDDEYIAYFKYSDGSEEKVSDKLGNADDSNSLAYKLENITGELIEMLFFWGMK